ncbi:MAG: VWA domain-containing protein [Verrucomicrobia bacterium]|nr:VWA domain-containing protein [Verrucomicrobiota bacterium]
MKFAELVQFAEPLWLVAALVALPAAAWAFRRFNQARLAALCRFAAPHLIESLTAGVSLARRSVKRRLLLTGLGLCFLALARPQVGFRWEETKRKGIDILFAVDASRSMLARDVTPDRLTRAKMAVLDLLDKLEGDRVGLIAFAGTAFLQCPMTLDYDAFRQSLDALDTRVIPKGGTDLSSAIREAEEAFSMGQQNHKILMLITDGEDLEAGGIAAARKAAEKELKIFTVGVGTSSGEIIPVRSESGSTEFVKDEKGEMVKSRLDESTLRQIAEVTGGFYEPLGQQAQGLEAINDRGLASIPRQDLTSRMNKVYLDRYQWPLALGIVCLALEMLIGERRRNWNFKFPSRNGADPIPARSPRFAALRRGSQRRVPPVADSSHGGRTGGANLKFWKQSQMVLMIFSIFCASHASLLNASPQSAERAYRQSRYSDALSQYKTAAEKKPKQAELQFNLGASAYRVSEFEEAASAFQKALQTGDTQLQQHAFYNLGNAQYRVGQPTEKTNPQQTIQQWQQALQSYDHALKLKPDDADARFNYELVKKKLEQLQKQQPKDDQKKQDKEQNPQDSSSKDHSKPDQQNPASTDPKDSSGRPDSKEPRQEHGSPPPKGANDQKQDQAGKPPQSEKKPGKEAPSETEPRRLPGQMTREEARNLLDSLKGDERKMPAAPMPVGNQAPPEDATKRDW